jgi:serine/threonine protein phosphatase 1
MSEPRTFVIGDIHGCPDEVACLLDAIQPASGDTVVFLGDYVDRGPSPRAVIDRLLRLRHEGPQCVFLKGNHEDMFLAFLGRGGLYGEAFLFNGGEATLRSYGLAGRSGQITADQLPPDHLEFLLSLQLHHRQADFLCVHAGISPARSLEEQEAEDLLWIRDEFISSPHPFPFTVLFGHTPQREVLMELPYKVGLDTGLVYWNKLSCLELREKRLYQIRRGERAVRSRSVRAQFEHRHEPAAVAAKQACRNHHREGVH